MPLIVLEGIDGSGKTTQIRMTKEFLENNGRPVHVFREPGGTEIGESIREILLHSEHPPHPVTQLMLFQASRAELIHTVVTPLLAKGSIVLMDRFVGSTIAYQGYAQGTLTPELLDTSKASISSFIATAHLKADMEIYLDVDLDVAYKRMQIGATEFDNFERDKDMMMRAKLGYETWYHGYCTHPFVYVNANEDAKTVNQSVLKHIWSNHAIIN